MLKSFFWEVVYFLNCPSILQGMSVSVPPSCPCVQKDLKVLLICLSVKNEIYFGTSVALAIHAVGNITKKK
jgi:hypothetical protein